MTVRFFRKQMVALPRLPKRSLLVQVMMVFSLLMPALLTACGAGGAQGGAVASGKLADKQVLRFLTINMPRSLDPIHIDAQRVINNGIAEPLVMQNDDATLRPWLAKSWKNVEPNVWEFQLQPNVKFWSARAGRR